MSTNSGWGFGLQLLLLVETGDFEGETGLQRCRAMMGTMAGMHRSMQSMMDGQMGARHDRGGMAGEVRSMHEQMGTITEDVDSDAMRCLCRTMHASMRAAMHGVDIATPDSADETAFEERSLSDETGQWLRGARRFEGVKDRTGQDEVVVEVGTGDGLRYGPTAVRVDPGTTVRWRWTGQGGLHDVAFANADIASSLKEAAGTTFAYTFDTPGEYRYECTLHASVGMRGAVIVAGEA